MTPEQKAAYIIAQATCAMARINGMMAENACLVIRGEEPKFLLEDFEMVTVQFGIGDNDVIGMFRS